MSLADALVELQELTERLRRECPWDREQTTRTIVPYTVEEAYEVADAALADDDAKLLDEIGDLLFQCVLPRAAAPGARAATSRRRRAASTRSSSRAIRTSSATPKPRKRRRVSGELGADQARRTRGAKGSSTTCPRACPALSYARKVQQRAKSVGFEYPDLAGALADFDDELRELREELPASDPPPETEPDGALRRSSATCCSQR